jgi:Ser/Thr protein kinase RdoA (MazF antagonist)
MTARRVSAAEAKTLCENLFSVSGYATELPSERDQNFALTAANGERFVFKIANADEEFATLQLQNAALRHADARVSRLELPKVIPTVEGLEIGVVRVAGAQHFTRLLTWLEGEPMVRVAPHGDRLLQSLGAGLAELDAALRDFSHPAMQRALRWDVRHADAALQHLPLLATDEQTIVRNFMQAHSAVRWESLRKQVIQGDANDHNVLVRQDRVVGLLDFGDMVCSAVACELAVALAYAMLDKNAPIQTARTVIGAYTAIFPLTSAEQDALYALTTARLCISVCYAAFNAIEKSSDPYQQVTAGPAWRLLRQLNTLPPNTGRNAFIDACGSL